MRAFIALPLAGEARERLAGTESRIRRYAEALGLRVKWTSPEQLHVNLKFLGDIDTEQARLLSDAMRRCALAELPIPASLEALSVFGPSRRAKVLVVGVSDPEGRIGRLAAALERAAEPLGVPAERRPFVPHVTLGRFREPSDATGLLAKPFGTEDAVVFDRIHLYESTLTPQGARHTLLAGEELGGARS